MSETGQRQRPKRLTAIDLMDDQAALPQSPTRDSGNDLRDLHLNRATCDVGERPEEENMRSYSSEGLQSSTPSKLEVERSRRIYKNTGVEVMNIAAVGKSAHRGHAESHGNQQSNSIHLARVPIHREDYGSTLRGPYFRHSTERLLPQTHPTMRPDHSVTFQRSSYPEFSSRPEYQRPPTINISDHSRFNEAYDQHIYPTPIEPHPSGPHPVPQADNEVSPYSPNHPIIGYNQCFQAPQGRHTFSRTTQPSFRSGLGPNFSPAHLAPSSAIVLPSRNQRDSKYRKLCNNHHLRGACILGDTCRYTHGTISQAQLKELKRIAKGIPCKYGLECNDELCYAGHKCPYNPCTRDICEFPAEMHYVGPESSRGRAVIRTDRCLENQRQNERSDRGNDKSLGPPPRRRRLSNREEIKREVDELMNEVAPWRNSQPELRSTMLPPPREITEHEMDLLDESLIRSYQGSQASSPRNRRPDILRYNSSGRSQASSQSEDHEEKRNRREFNASSHGYSGGQGRSFRVTKADSWRPAEGRRRH